MTDKTIIFKMAHKISNQIVLWNTPDRKKLLTEELKAKLNDKLYDGNKIDDLIVKELGSGGWYEGDPEKLSDEKAKELFEQADQARLLILEAEAAAGKVGELHQYLQHEPNS